MNVRVIEQSEYAVWDELVHQHGALFNRLDWLSIFGDKMQTLGLFDAGGTMIGGMSLYQECRWGLRILRRAPFTPTCGPFIAIKSQNPVAILEERRKALDCMVDYLEIKSAAICMLPLDRRISDALPFLWRGYKVTPNYTYLLDLSQPIEQIKKNMSSERRKNIAAAGRDGLSVRQTTDMSVVRDLVLATFGRQDKSVDKVILEAILFKYANPSNSLAFTTYRGDSPIATCFVVHDSETAYYLLGGYSESERHHGAGALAMFEAITCSKAMGLKTFDFEGSVIPAIERYFRGFGGQLKPYFTVNKAWLPLEMVLKLSKRGNF